MIIEVKYAVLGANPSVGFRRFNGGPEEVYTWLRNTVHVKPVVITEVREASPGVRPTPRGPRTKGKGLL